MYLIADFRLLLMLARVHMVPVAGYLFVALLLVARAEDGLPDLIPANDDLPQLQVEQQDASITISMSGDLLIDPPSGGTVIIQNVSVLALASRLAAQVNLMAEHTADNSRMAAQLSTVQSMRESQDAVITAQASTLAYLTERANQVISITVPASTATATTTTTKAPSTTTTTMATTTTTTKVPTTTTTAMTSTTTTTTSTMTTTSTTTTTTTIAPIIRTLDSTGNVGMYASLQLNGQGNPVVVYFDATNQLPKISTCSDKTCTQTPIPLPVDYTPSNGQFLSFKISSAGTPVVAHCNAANWDLYVSACETNTCDGSITTSNIDNTDSVGQFTSLQFGPSGYPVVTYCDVTHTTLKIAFCSSSDCSSSTIKTLDNDDNVGQYSSLQMSSQGHPRVAYYDAYNNDLKYLMCADALCATWNTTALATAGNVGTYASMQLRTNGSPVIAFRNISDSSLAVVICSDAACTGRVLATLDATGDAGRYCSLQLDSDGFAVVSYFDGATAALKLARCRDSLCSTSFLVLRIVDADGVVGAHTSLQLTPSSSFPVIAYQAVDLENLKLAICQSKFC